jgi:peptidoglycan/xylan/chitin deacetylase (PgdA/CDA1 family)
MTTRYIAAYDTERPNDCLAACRQLRMVHERFAFPATFFIVGQTLEQESEEYRKVLGEFPLFEIASHTYSHRLLRDHPLMGLASEPEERLREIRLGKEIVEQTFERPCQGLRPGYGFADALRGDKWLLGEIVAVGHSYVSSLLWGPDTTMPALLERPFTYAEDGYSQLWELPGHGWHENLLKAHNPTTHPQRIIAWPLVFPELMLPGPVATPADEFAVNRILIDKAVENDLPYVSLIWHPWSLNLFDPSMKMLELTFSYVRDRGLEPTTFEGECQRLVAMGSNSDQKS